MTSRSPVATDPATIFTDLEAAAERARDRAAQELEQQESVEELPAEAAAAAVSRAVRAARGAALMDGASALEKLAKDPDADLSEPERFGVEAIVLLEGRPALPVQAGDFWNPPEEWQSLLDHRAAIRESIAGVGRIDVTGHPDLDWIGTGFLVAADVVMTNRHVASEFSRRDGDRWTFRSGRSARIDLLEELGGSPALEFAVTDVIGIHEDEDVDLALLRVAVTGTGDAALPQPLRIAAAEPDDLVGRPVYVVGYPAWDGRRNEPEPMRRIFMDVYNVKRLQPGVTVVSQTPESVLRHDCSTLGGNSGSPVFDLASHTVVGLHFGGRYGVGNYAVPMWRLVDDALVASAGLNFA
ncbi:MAG TPA: serine protease [Jiangellaceae bacterium]